MIDTLGVIGLILKAITVLLLVIADFLLLLISGWRFKFSKKKKKKNKKKVTEEDDGIVLVPGQGDGNVSVMVPNHRMDDFLKKMSKNFKETGSPMGTPSIDDKKKDDDTSNGGYI
jgi:hypothetical protein